MAKLSKTKERRQQMVKDFLRRKLFTSSGSIREVCRYYWAVNGKQGRADDSGRRRGPGQQYDGVDA